MRFRLLRTFVCVAVSLAATLVCLTVSSPAGADCTTGGSSCLPGSGYADPDVQWSCAINAANCYWNSVTDARLASLDDFGWGSAAYNGAGSVFVCVRGGGVFVGCAYNLARACYSASCNDQDIVNIELYVQNQSGVTHTIEGHGYR
jgi:hypothetical protein